jgi:hypothetical protein
MSDVAITPTPLGVNTSYRRVISPSHVTASYSTQNTNNNDIRFAGGGKSVITISIDNAPNKSLVGYLYGIHSAAGVVADAGSALVDNDPIEIAAASKEAVSFIGLACPYYLLRLTHSDTPTDTPAKAVSVYIDLAQGV